jgi:hypothetical protein
MNEEKQQERNRLKEALELSLAELLHAYLEDSRLILTENDMVMLAYGILVKNGVPKHSLHTELRPYIGSDDRKCKVIRKTKQEDASKTKLDWHEQDKANQGARFDLVVVHEDDENDDFWERALKKAKSDQRAPNGLRYWRILSYPCKAFGAVIEFKAKVYNNMDRIHDDITRLKLLHDENSDCLKYLVVMDRCASEDNVKQIRNWLSDSDIHPYLVGEND